MHRVLPRGKAGRYYHIQLFRERLSEKNVHVTIPKGNQVRIHTGFHRFTEIGHIFHIKYIYQNKNTLQVEIWSISHLNDLEIQERGL